MGIFDGVLLATDFDETLCARGGYISAADRSALLRFTEQGGLFTVATGRPLRTFLPFADDLPLTAPAVLSNGAMLFDFAAGEAVACRLLPDTIRADAMTLAERFPSMALELYVGLQAVAVRPNHATRLHALRVRCGYREITLARLPADCLKLILEDREPVLHRAQDFIRTVWGDRYEAVFSSPILLELTAPGCSKGAAVLDLAERLGVDQEHIYCVGDNQNDLTMLQAARQGFCPANATAEVLAAGMCPVGPGGDGCLRDVVDLLTKRYAHRKGDLS